MKRKNKIAALALTVIIVLSLSAIHVFAETIYDYYGIKFTIINNYNVAIAGCADDMTEVSIPNEINGRKVVEIKNHAFIDNDKITSVSLFKAKALERIGMFAFQNCTGLTGKISIPNSVTSMDSCAFEGCSSITGISFGTGVTAVPNQCCNECTSLSNITLHNGITTIGYYAFANCPSLEYLVLGRNITSVARSAFQNDSNLILGVYKNTYAHEYVVANKLTHIVIDGGKLGDVNGDGVVDILDATEIQKYAAESTDFTDEQFELGDINKDGYCDVIDALLVQKSVIGAYEIPQNIIRY